jgi:hypothetical protein
MDVLRRSLFVTGHAMAVDGGFVAQIIYLSNLTLMNPIDHGPTIQHNLSNYDKVKATFSWKYCARKWTLMEGLNIAYEAVDRHAQNHLKIQLHFVLFEKTEVPRTLPIPI